jgi:hypothetical protein
MQQMAKGGCCAAAPACLPACPGKVVSRPSYHRLCNLQAAPLAAGYSACRLPPVSTSVQGSRVEQLWAQGLCSVHRPHACRQVPHTCSLWAFTPAGHWACLASAARHATKGVLLEAGMCALAVMHVGLSARQGKANCMGLLERQTVRLQCPAGAAMFVRPGLPHDM